MFKPGQLAAVERTNQLLVQILGQNGKVPTRGTEFAAGYDLYSAEEITLNAKTRQAISTAIAILVPSGTYGGIAPRSGLALKHSIDIGAGVVHEDYRGPIKVILINHGKDDFVVKVGDRMAQLVLECIVTLDTEMVNSLPESTRGDKGFGSTGVSVVHPRVMAISIIKENHKILTRRIIAVKARERETSPWLDQIREAGKLDDQWMSYKSQLKSRKVFDTLSLEDGLVLYKKRNYIPNSNKLKLTVTRRYHDTRVARHFGRHKTMERMTRTYYWPDMDQWVRNYVRTCDACQLNKTARHKKYGPLKPLEIPYRPWEHISMDFITELPSVSGYDQIWVIVDRFSKMAHFVPLKSRTAPTLAKAFVIEIWRLHGLPLGVVSDRDTVFTSKLWTEVMRFLDVSQDMSTAYHPQTDGQTERVNQVLEQYLRTFWAWDQKDWLELLPYAEFCYNNTVHSATKVTPFYANFGYHPIDNYPAEVVESNVPAAKEYVENLAKLRKDMRETLILTRERMAKYYNRNVSEKEPTFKVGDKVMVNAKDIKTKRKSKKLDHKMRGPFKVKRLIGSYAYELPLPYGGRKVHPVYHISLLEPYHRNEIPGRRSPSPQPVVDLGDDIREVAKILASRVHRRRVQYRVR